jgi:hypothetical protein
MSLTGIPELKESYRKLGPTRFWLVMLGTLTFISIGAALAITLDYPRAFGSTCHHKCMVENYWYSPALLRRGSVLAYALFAWLWLIPAMIPAAFIYARIKKRRDRTFL